MTRTDHENAVLAAHERYTAAVAIEDELARRLAAATREREAADAELKALARRKA